MRYQYFVNFTYGDKTKVIHKDIDLQKAMEIAKEKQAEYKAAGRTGMITVYENTAERGAPMQKIYEFFEV